MLDQHRGENRDLMARRGRREHVCRRAVEALENRVLFAAEIVGSSTVYPTIQAAVNAANAGDTVTVDPGTYNEQVVVEQSITIEGAQAGVDARTGSRLNGSASESIVTGATSGSVKTSAFYIDANDVTIDGFTVQGETNQSTSKGAGIVISPGTSGTQIINNIVQNNVSGLFLANASSSDGALIQHNVFRDNNNDGVNGGRGIYTDEDISGGNLTNVTINANTFTNNYGGNGTTNLEAACAFEASIAGAQSNITITNNVMNGNGKAALFLNATNITFNGNTVTGCQDQYSGSIRFEGNVQNVTIDNNNVHDNTGPAVAVDSKGTSGSSSGFVLNNNDFVNNNAAYGTNISVVYSANSYDGVFNAQNDWWGSASGPSGDGSGSGDAVSAGTFQAGTGLGWALLAGGDTVYSPWSTSPNTSSASPPTAPTGLGAVANSPTQVTLSWTDTAAGVEKGFVVQRSLDGTNFSTVGTTATGVTTFVDKTTAASTAYSYRVYAANTVGDSTYSSVATVTTPAAVTLAAPSNLTATAASSTQVNLSWTDTDAAVETGFVIQRSTSGGTFAQVGTTAKGVTAFSNTGLSAATSYSYRVEANTASGTSPWSSTAAITTPSASLTAPSGLSAAASSSTQVNLSWTDTDAAVETGFIIQRSTSGGAYSQIGTTGKGVTTFSNTGLSAGTTYSYRVAANSSGGASPWSTTASATTPGLVTVPTGLSAVAISPTQVKLLWTDTTSKTETGFIIQRSLAGGAYVDVGAVALGTTTFTDKVVSPETAYSYRVAATSPAGPSAFSAAAAITTHIVATAPITLTAVAISQIQANLSWADTASGIETGFIIQRSTNGTTYSQVGTTLAGMTTFSDKAAVANTTFYYRVIATSAGGNSPASNVAKIATPPLPTAPTSLSASVKSATLIMLTWSHTTATLDTGAIIQRSTDGVNFVQIGTAARGVLTYSDPTARPGITYSYRVQESATGGVSAFSTVVKTKTPTVPKTRLAAAPTGLKAIAASATQVNLSWTNPAGTAATGFAIDRSTDGVHFTQVGTTAGTVVTYSDKTASGAVTYTYKVQSVSTGGTSAFSTAVTIKTPAVPLPAVAKAPTGLKAVAASSTQINLTWTNNAGTVATGFIIQRSTNGTTFTQIGATKGSVITYMDHTAVAGITYIYRVQAISLGGNSGFSNTVTIKAPSLTAPPLAPAPTSLKATVSSSTLVNLSWVESSTAPDTGFIVERSLDGTSFVQVGAGGAGVLAYADHSVAHGTTYTYRVIAVSAGGVSANSSAAVAKP